MRLIATARASDGTKLGRDILIGRPDGTPLLRAGVTLTPRYRRRLIQAGISAIYVDDEASAGIVVDAPVDAPTQILATRAIANMQEIALKALDRGTTLREDTVLAEAVSSLTDIVGRILNHISKCGGVALALGDLCSADAYTFQHSIDVAAVGLLIGRRHFQDYGWTDYRGEQRFDNVSSRLTTLGVGLLLHDIGKLVVPMSIINKPGKLTPEEWEIVKLHPRAGIDMLGGDSWDPLIKAIVLRHHERWDGSGYPDGQVGARIHQMARIAAVADVYDALTSERQYAPAEPAAAGVRAILSGAGTLYDPDVVDSFAKVVAPFPAGTEVTLSDGRTGIVARVPHEDLHRPTVRVLDADGIAGEVDLLARPDLQIRGWNHTSAVSREAVA
jgi:HD-GYP domain-containing protein (c-di-GMP phosphodiesterase class II)